MAYNDAVLTSPYHYTLKATGGGGNELRRAVYGTWVNSATVNTGSSHPNNSRFCYAGLLPLTNTFRFTPSGLIRISVPPTWLGLTLYFKFVQFNQFGGGYAELANVTASPYTVIGNGSPVPGGGGIGGQGTGGSSVYTINPPNPLVQTTSTNIH